MPPPGCEGALTSFYDLLREATAAYAGRVEYGNLRYTVSEWENAGGDKITNVALVYETPGGSTDQINISYDHSAGQFALVDENREFYTHSVDEVLASVLPRIHAIPERRRDALTSEIRRQIDEGVGRAGLFGHINRLTQSDFKGGTITHLELKEAMQFAVHYMRTRDNPS